MNFLTSNWNGIVQKLAKHVEIFAFLVNVVWGHGVRFFHVATSKGGRNLVIILFFTKIVLSISVHFFHIASPKRCSDLTCFHAFDSKCTSRHIDLHFFHISTSKRCPKPRCFGIFSLEMCFAPQRHAFFSHLIFQKSSDNGVLFCTFLFQNVLRAIPACTISTSQFAKVARDRGVLPLFN